MDAQSAYSGALAGLMGGGPPPASTGPGGMPGPPPPTNIGAMQTGDPMNDPRAAASATILALREMKNHFPAAGDRIDGIIQELQSLAKPTSQAPAPGALTPPGGAPPIGGAAPGASPMPVAPLPVPG